MEPTLDRCPGYNLYIGGFIGLRRTQALKNCNITHIISVLDWEFKEYAPLIRGYQHLHIPVDDVEDENLLEWFPRSNHFIQKGLQYQPSRNQALGNGVDSIDERGSGVYVHCAMGKSRSATILLAYLLWTSRQSPAKSKTFESEDMVSLPSRPLSVVEALELLRQGRPFAEPNEGFMDQLHMYEKMGCPTSNAELQSHKIYRRWMNKRKVAESLSTMQAPEMDSIIFEDESTNLDNEEGSPNESTSEQDHMQSVAPGVRAPDGSSNDKAKHHASLRNVPHVSIKCRKCRHVLANTPFVLDHKPPPHRDPSSEQQLARDGNPLPPPQCAHIFLHPLSWMREVLSEAKMEGRLTCPNNKCGANIGKFSWTGLRCSCGGWVTPGFGIIRTKVDEIVARPPAGKTSDGLPETAQSDDGTLSLPASMAGLRLPPGMKRQGNL